eukprot:908539-Pelagomonas_calceolata.AAC.4
MGVPKRQYTIEELRLNKIDAPKIISPTDSSLSTARRLLQFSVLDTYSTYYFDHDRENKTIDMLNANTFIIFLKDTLKVKTNI